jgi:hypothetical protein
MSISASIAPLEKTRQLAFLGPTANNRSMSTEASNIDQRTPSPPYGYSRECTHNREQQIHIVAEFHAHKIRPSRIAYRVGIDIAFIEELIAGEIEADRFPRLVAYYRRQRYQQRMRDSNARRGISRYEQQQRIEREFLRETDL